MNNAINIKNLTFKYPDGALALDSINLEIAPGESIGIIGPNGAGKSTLLLHLNGTLRSRNGNVMIQGMPINNANIKTVRQKVGMVFQDPDDQLFMPTVFDDIAFGLLNLGLAEDDIRKKVKDILAKFGMSDFERRSPHHLSLGEKKKIALAGILVLEPEILVFDEPTANLDPRGQWEFMNLLDGITQTKIVASHDLEMIRALCQRVIIINHGKLVAAGSSEEIMGNNKLLQDNNLMHIHYHKHKDGVHAHPHEHLDHHH